MGPFSVKSLTSAIAVIICFAARVDFTNRPRDQMTLFFSVTDEAGQALTDGVGRDIAPVCDAETLAWVVSAQMSDNKWRVSWVKGAPLFTLRGSDKAPVKSVEFKSTRGWTPEVKMVPVLRAPPPKADDKK